MKLELKNGTNVAVSFDKKGHLKSAAQTLEGSDIQGFISVAFLNKNLAQETCVSTSHQFSSIKLYEKDKLIREVCTDSLYKRAFYYAYNEAGHVMETHMQSFGTATKEEKEKRTLITHSPASLFESLTKDPMLIVNGKPALTENIFTNRSVRARAA